MIFLFHLHLTQILDERQVSLSQSPLQVAHLKIMFDHIVYSINIRAVEVVERRALDHQIAGIEIILVTHAEKSGQSILSIDIGILRQPFLPIAVGFCDAGNKFFKIFFCHNGCVKLNNFRCAKLR